MPQKPQTPEIGNFRMPIEQISPAAPTMPIDPPGFSFPENSEGLAAIRNFTNFGKQGSMATPQSVTEPPVAPSKGPTPENLDAQIAELHKTASDLEKSPENTYLDRLKKHNISIDKAREIVDNILFRNEHQETYPVTQKHTVTFKSRMFSDQERALRALEQMSPQYPATMAAVVSKSNLAASVVRFAGLDFTKMAIKDKAEYIEKLPESLVRLLAIKLSKFDQMIMDIMDDGVIENF